MTQKHPITPSPELVEQWDSECESDIDAAMYLAIQAARWGADQELEACCEWLEDFNCSKRFTAELRIARRPKPPSLKEQAIEILDDIDTQLDAVHYNILRRALETLSD